MKFSKQRAFYSANIGTFFEVHQNGQTMSSRHSMSSKILDKMLDKLLDLLGD